MIELYRKYLEGVPRYASYPTVKGWRDRLDAVAWTELLRGRLSEDSGLGMYVHVPFCESLCSFCGCNTSITRDHAVEEVYVDLLLKEWATYREAVPALQKSKLKKLYLGGGTPNFLSPESLERLLASLCSSSGEDFVGYCELDPRYLSVEQIEILFKSGFRYASLGVQDLNDGIVGEMRPGQSEKLVREKVGVLREGGFSEIGFDLIYGLPGQSLETWRETLVKMKELSPERISLYRWVVSDWMKCKQESRDTYQWEMYDFIRAGFLEMGYQDFGMDHFALPDSRIQRAHASGQLDKAFSGYQCVKTDATIGLGVSAISELRGNYHQNQKALPVYQREVERGNLPSHRGVLATERQLQAYTDIWQLSVKHEVQVEKNHLLSLQSDLPELFEHGLAFIENSKLKLASEGVPFLRAVALNLEKSWTEAR